MHAYAVLAPRARRNGRTYCTGEDTDNAGSAATAATINTNITNTNICVTNMETTTCNQCYAHKAVVCAPLGTQSSVCQGTLRRSHWWLSSSPL